jgi:FAD/FMN-containing dehydrogenase
LSYDSIEKAVNDCPLLMKLEPSALELVDNYTMKNFGIKFPKKTNCLLFLEFDSDIQNNIGKLKKIYNGRIMRVLHGERKITEWWNLRNSALYFSLKNLLADQSLPHIIEDATVPVEKLKNLVAITQNIRKTFGARIVMYGHAGNGNIHIRLAMPKKDKKVITKIAKMFFPQIIKLGGTTTGEHGDGLARTKFVKMQYGPTNYAIFRKLKRRFDPDLILNPNKIVT